MCRLIAQPNREACHHDECRAFNPSEPRSCIRGLPMIIQPRPNELTTQEIFPNELPMKKIQLEPPATNVFDNVTIPKPLHYNSLPSFNPINNFSIFQQIPLPTTNNNNALPFAKQTQQQQQQQQTVDSNNNGSMTNAFNLLMNQNKILMELKEKEERVEQTILYLINEISALKGAFQANQINVQCNSGYSTGNRNTEAATSEILLKTICPKANEFIYSLNIVGEFPTTLYRERYFKLEAELIDNRTGQRAQNPNKIRLALGIYTSENPPKSILVNTSGNKVFKGSSEVDLVSGTCVFDKVQVNEVSSHFLNGWFFMVVYPIFTAENAQSMGFLANYSGGLFIDPTKIKPLMLEKVVVKAKKLKND